MHDEYQEICAAASIGQAAPEEIARLGEHLVGCSVCRRAYSEFTSIAAHRYVQAFATKGISSDEEQRIPDSALMRRRFLQRAAEKGILPSGRVRHLNPERPLFGFVATWQAAVQRITYMPSIAAIVGLTAIAASLLLAHELGIRMSPKLPGTTQSEKISIDAVAVATVTGPDLAALNINLQGQVARLKRDLRTNQEQLRSLRESLNSASEDKQKLAVERVRLETAATELQRRLAEVEGLFQLAKEKEIRLQEEAARLRNEAGSAQATYVADQIRIRELGEELADKTAASARNDQLLQRDRDIRDLMTARNLHIFDVYDTDAKGKTRPVFGRIFYTEGKSLIFYAYDLNEAKVENASYHYRVWGGQEAQKDQATSLGVFYSDDKSQRRWVFKCDDPKILRQIDSVFVTLEPAGAPSSHPKGQKLLDAYLRGIPNHP